MQRSGAPGQVAEEVVEEPDVPGEGECFVVGEEQEEREGAPGEEGGEEMGASEEGHGGCKVSGVVTWVYGCVSVCVCHCG